MSVTRTLGKLTTDSGKNLFTLNTEHKVNFTEKSDQYSVGVNNERRQPFAAQSGLRLVRH